MVRLVLALVIAVALLEIGLRVVASNHSGVSAILYMPQVTHDYDNCKSLPELLGKAPLGFRPLMTWAGFILNSRSFRTPEYTESKNEDDVRVVVFGDSFAFGSGGVPYSDMWTTRFGRILNEQSERKVEVINLAVGGIGLFFMKRLWQLEGRKLDADVVVLSFCVGNDFVDGQGALGETSKFDSFYRLSYSARLTRNLIRIARGVERDVSPLAPPMPGARGGTELEGYQYDGNQPTFSEQGFERAVAWRMEICRQDKLTWFRSLCGPIFAALTDLAADVEAAGAQLLVVVIPEEYQVHSGLAGQVAMTLGADVNAWDLRRPQAALAEFFEQSGIAYVDLLDPFVSASATRLYRIRDTHWNLEGNRLAGIEVARRIGQILKD